jgi:hypothetical protein
MGELASTSTGDEVDDGLVALGLTLGGLDVAVNLAMIVLASFFIGARPRIWFSKVTRWLTSFLRAMKNGAHEPTATSHERV